MLLSILLNMRVVNPKLFQNHYKIIVKKGEKLQMGIESWPLDVYS